MGGGLPLGGIITSIKLSNVWSKGNHGTTYGGNAVACRTGSVVIDLLENGLLNHVNIIGNYLHQQLKEIMAKHPQKVLQVRGHGLMKGLLLSFDAQILVDELLKNKVIANAASGSVLRIVPPLIIDENDVDEFVRLLDISLSALSE
jgi:acetylornithine/N-succinyldiaminopimelate aminotransferase